MDHFLPWDDFLFFSLSNDLDDYLFFPAQPSATAAGVVFVNTPQKCCEQSQGQEPPAAGWPRFHVLVIVTPLQITDTDWRFYLEIQAFFAAERTSVKPSQPDSQSFG